MLRAAPFLLKMLLAAMLYGVVFYSYAPSDVTQGTWLFKPGTFLLFGRIFGLFFIYRMMKLLFFSGGQSFLGRMFSALCAIPAYVFLTLLLMLFMNGFNDKQSQTTNWQTNIIYFKNFHLACVVAGIDDAELHYKTVVADIVFVPGKFCSLLAKDTFTSHTLTPYTMVFSDGAFSIPYVTAVEKR